MLKSTATSLMRAGRHVLAAVLPWVSDRRYLDAYAAASNVQAKLDPQQAVGGSWERIGDIYFRALKERGLEPRHTFLDFGCGSLRIGRHLIRYLEPGHYVGADMAGGLIKAGRELIEREGLAHKRPTLIKTRGELDFSFVAGRQFDFILATSVFTHLRPHMIEECLSNARKIMHPGSVFFFTFIEGDEIYAVTAKQPWSFYEDIARRYDLAIERHDDYDREHPLGQRLASVWIGARHDAAGRS